LSQVIRAQTKGERGAKLGDGKDSRYGRMNEGRTEGDTCRKGESTSKG